MKLTFIFIWTRPQGSGGIQMSTVQQAVSFTEEVLEACRGLGRARVVLRNPVGVAEAFVDLVRLELHDGWANLCVDAVHVHAQVQAIGGVRFVEPGATCGCKSPAIWFAGQSGSPLLLLVLDQTAGEERILQERAFERLRELYGDARALVSSADVPARDAMS
jgi:hypothetical protein